MSILDNIRKRFHTPREQQAEQSVPAPAPAPAKPADIVDRALGACNCAAASSVNDSGNTVWQFTYQGGNFIINLMASHPFASLGYLGIGEWEATMLDPVRFLCNKLTSNTFLSALTYRLDPDTNRVQVDISIDFPVVESTPSLDVILPDLMQHCFLIQREFLTSMSKITADNPTLSLEGNEMQSYLQERMKVLSRFDITRRDNGLGRPVDTAMTLGDLAATLWPKLDQALGEARVITPGAMTTVADAAGYTLLSPLSDDNERVLIDTTIADNRRLSVAIDRVADPAGNPMARVTATLSGGVPSADATAISQRRRPDVREIYIPLNTKSLQQQTAEYDFMWHDALDKMAEGKEKELTDAQRAIVNATVPEAGLDLYHGIRLFNEDLPAQALPHLLNALDLLIPLYDTVNDDAKQTVLETIFYTGISYARLGRMRDAFYYLDILYQANNIEWTTAYIDCLTTMDDIRTRHIIEAIIDRIEKSRAESREPMPDYIEQFLNYLNLRLATAYINREMLDEAETLLRPLLDIDKFKSRAMKEMSRITQLRKKNDNNADQQ